MRWSIVLLLVACGSSADRSCPTGLADGDPCGFIGQCWHADTFSSCLSGWCTCAGGRTTCTGLAPQTGDACGDEPITQCSYEGNPSCDTLPTTALCSCADDGTWLCECACYGALTTCPTDPCDVPPARLAGAACSDVGTSCSYPGSTTCTCEAVAGGAAMFRCF